MDALALAGRGALVFVCATRASSGANGEHPCSASVTFHDSSDTASDPSWSGFSVVSFDDELPGALSRVTDKVADQFGVEP